MLGLESLANIQEGLIRGDGDGICEGNSRDVDIERVVYSLLSFGLSLTNLTFRLVVGFLPVYFRHFVSCSWLLGLLNIFRSMFVDLISLVCLLDIFDFFRFIWEDVLVEDFLPGLVCLFLGLFLGHVLNPLQFRLVHKYVLMLLEVVQTLLPSGCNYLPLGPWSFLSSL